MATTVTVKGQVTLPKSVREAAGIKAGDSVDVRNGSGGAVIIEKSGASEAYAARIRAVADRRLIRDGLSTDEFMKMMRGDPAEDPVLPDT